MATESRKALREQLCRDHDLIHRGTDEPHADAMEALESYGRVVEAATIERCAQIAEQEKVDYEATKSEDDLAYNTALEHAAAAIRALKGE